MAIERITSPGLTAVAQPGVVEVALVVNETAHRPTPDRLRTNSGGALVARCVALT